MNCLAKLNRDNCICLGKLACSTFLMCLLVNLPTALFAQEAKVGQILSDRPEFSDLRLTHITASSVENVSLGELMNDKVVLLEFWAPWCGSCLVEFPRLTAMQEEFGEDLIVLMVSVENDEERIQKFVKSRKTQLATFVDPESNLYSLFPHRLIPHAVLIGRNKRVEAITNSKNITSEVVKEAIAGKAIRLPLKKDNLKFDFNEDYFQLDKKTEERFELQPGNPDIPGAYTTWGAGGFDRERRISMLNASVVSMYMYAHQIPGITRVIHENENPSYMNSDNAKTRFCLDFVVSKDDVGSFYQIFQEKLGAELEERMGVKGRTELRKMDVFVLARDESKPLKLKRLKKGAGGHADSNTFSVGTTTKNFAKYLESTVVLGKPVVDETGLTGPFQFNFTFDPDVSNGLNDAVEDMGFTLREETRSIKVLLLSELDVNDKKKTRKP